MLMIADDFLEILRRRNFGKNNSGNTEYGSSGNPRKNLSGNLVKNSSNKLVANYSEKVRKDSSDKLERISLAVFLSELWEVFLWDS